ncbi:MAG TPA: metallophosphoesterase family protein [Candidatus Hydrogenedentes bacterium]|nr:metallophosphoesterase family protein [Candidatus Hydrogenedentota bacterium]
MAFRKITSSKSRLLFTGLILIIIVPGLWFLAGEAKDWVKSIYAANVPRTTAFPSSSTPDQICLTWNGDPATTQAIQWRTNPAVTEGIVQYRKRDETSAQPMEVKAEVSSLEDRLVGNDPVNQRFTATLKDLSPDTVYAYRVGSPAVNSWSLWLEFATAPVEPESFSFIYLGDLQVGMFAWNKLLNRAKEIQPNTAFYIMAGDIVNRGTKREEWDELFNEAQGFFDNKPFVPALGNHDYAKQKSPEQYLKIFALPENGPGELPKELAYSFTYSNAFFVVLDGNQPPEKQSGWLDQQLAGSRAVWKFAVFHQPAYSSKSSRDNEDIRESWGALFDRYHVDMVLQGHDHAYLRTYPMKDGKKAASAKEGTYYVVSVSGSKFYDQESHDYAEVGFTKTDTFQIIDIQTNGKSTCTYRAYDAEGKIRDEVVIEK